MTGTRKTAAAPAPAARVPLTFAAVKAQIKRPRRIVPLVLDTEAAAEIDALAELLERTQQRDATSGEVPLAPGVAKRLLEVERVAQDSATDFVLQAISHRAYRDLQKEHPPTAEQVAEAPVGQRVTYDPDSFAPALVLAQLLSPEPPEPDEWMAFWDELSDGLVRELYNVALEVQLLTVQLGSRSATTEQVLRELGIAS
jgi:hypothetical protein